MTQAPATNIHRPADRPIVCVQGLGFVGAAMSAAVASAKTPDGHPRFTVIGLDLPTADGQRRIEAVNAGRFPFETTDDKLQSAISEARYAGNLEATANDEAYGEPTS